MPTTVTSLLVTAILLLPGVVYVTIRERRTPQSNRSTFRETAAVLFAGIVFTAAALGTSALFGLIAPSVVPNIDQWFDMGFSYIKNNYWLVTLWAVCVVVVACIFAGGAAAIAFFLQHPSKFSSWWVLFERLAGNSSVHVGCELEDGAWIEGRLASFSSLDQDSPDRALIRVEPITYRSESMDEATAPGCAAVCISARRINAMFVSYLPDKYWEEVSQNSSQGVSDLPSEEGEEASPASLQ